MNFYKERLIESIFYLSEVYNVPYEVLAYIFGISRSSVHRLKMSIKKSEKDLEKIKAQIKNKIETYILLPKEYSELETF